MIEASQEVTSIFQLEKRTSISSKLMATTALFLAGTSFSVILFLVHSLQGMMAITRWMAILTSSFGCFFVVVALVYLWFSKCPPRLYIVIERCFVALLMAALLILTAAVLWKTFD